MMDHVQHGPLHFPAGLITVRQCRRMMIEQADAVLLQGIRHLGKIHMKQIPIGKKIPAEMRAENNGGIGGTHQLTALIFSPSYNITFSYLFCCLF